MTPKIDVWFLWIDMCRLIFGHIFSDQNLEKQECIPVGRVPAAC